MKYLTIFFFLLFLYGLYTNHIGAGLLAFGMIFVSIICETILNRKDKLYSEMKNSDSNSTDKN
jgi:hypothetical protein